MGLITKKNILSLIIIAILLIAIPFGLKLLQEQQIIKSRAAAGPIVFQGVNVSTQNGRQVFRLDDQGTPTVGLTLTSPFGPGSNINQPASSAQGNSSQAGSSSSPTVQPAASGQGQFGSGQTGISGRVYVDTNKNGLLDAGERGVGNTAVVMGKVGASGDVLLPSTTTDINGDYTLNLSNVPAGQYRVTANDAQTGLTGTTTFNHSGPVSGNVASGTVIYIRIIPN